MTTEMKAISESATIVSEKILNEWRTLLCSANVSEHSIAKKAAATIRVTGDNGFKRFVMLSLDLTERTADKYLRMGKSLAVEPCDSVALWKACGWRGVRLLLEIAGPKDRRIAFDEIVEKAEESGGYVGESSVRKIVADLESKDSPTLPTRSSQGRDPDRLTLALDVLRRVIEKFPTAKSMLSPKEIALLGLER